MPLKERCPLCRSFFTLRQRAKVDKSIDIDEVGSAEYTHDTLVENYKDEEREGSYDSDDILFTS